MKTKKIAYPIMVLIIMLISTSVFSQERRDRREREKCFDRERTIDRETERGPFIPDLTDEQKEKIKEIKVAEMKNIQPLENKIGEKEARLKTLISEETSNFKEIDQTVDAIFDLKAEIRKEQLRSRSNIRELLTDEQLIVFDKHPCPMQGKMRHLKR